MAATPFVDNYIPSPGASYRGGITTQFANGVNSNWLGMRRPYLDDHDRPCVTIHNGRWTVEKGEKREALEKVLVRELQNRGVNLPIWNTTSLRKDEWIAIDKEVQTESRQRLRAWGDLAAANTYSGFDGMGTMTLEYESMTDFGFAVVDMDAISPGKTDEPQYTLRSLPLPITHSDFFFSERRLATTRGRGNPLDTSLVSQGVRRISEMVEKTTIGVETGVTYGTQSVGYGAHEHPSKVYGYINYVNRLTKTDLTIPLGTNPEATVQDVLEMREQLFAAGFFGPYMLYTSTDWDVWFDSDYARLGGDNANMTLRDRLRRIDGIQDVRRLDYLTAANSHAYTMVMVSMEKNTARAVIGMPMRVVQWESAGGMAQYFKIMCIYVPQLRSDGAGNCGILHARTA